MHKTQPSVSLPWNELIQAFIAGLPHRLEVMKESKLDEHPLMEFTEFRVLSFGGPRQCGKTEAGLKVVRENESARFLYHLGYLQPDAIQNEEILSDRTLYLEDLTEEKLKGVKLMVIDNEGYLESPHSPYPVLATVFQQHREWFDPDFLVIRIL